jgi:hypothetical protein
LNDPDAVDPAPASSGWRVLAMVRPLVLFVVFLVLPMLLLAAMTHPQGCGGG